MAMPNSPPVYKHRATLEDLIALLCGIKDNKRRAFILAFRGEGPEAQDAICLELREQGGAIDQALRIVQEHWCEIQKLIDEE